MERVQALITSRRMIDLFANVLTDKNDLRKCIDRLES